MSNRRVVVTLTGTYELHPEHYPEGATPEEMMKIDKNNDNLDFTGIIESLGDTVEIEFKLVEESNG